MSNQNRNYTITSQTHGNVQYRKIYQNIGFTNLCECQMSYIQYRNKKVDIRFTNLQCS